MKNNLHRVLVLTAVMFCMAAFSVTAHAGAYYASNESGTDIPPDSIDSITISTEEIALQESGSNASMEIDGESVDLDSLFESIFSTFSGTDALTPVGNVSLVDDILQSESYTSVEDEQQSKQFITVQSKNGNYFYIIIDRSGDTENVYFLNLVDETDLMALLEEAPVEASPVVCSCIERCAIGAVNTDCEICTANMNDCVGEEPEPEEPAVVELQEPEEESTGVAMIIAAVIILAVVAGVILYFFVIKPKQEKASFTDFDDFDLEDEEYLRDDE